MSHLHDPGGQFCCVSCRRQYCQECANGKSVCPSCSTKATDATGSSTTVKSSMNPKVGGKLRRRLLTSMVTTAAAITIPFISATNASASTGDQHVDLGGYAECSTGTWSLPVPAQQTWVYVESTGERELQNATWDGENVAHLDSIGFYGSWVQVFIYCAVPGQTPGWRYADHLYVNEPTVGIYDGPHWEFS